MASARVVRNGARISRAANSSLRSAVFLPRSLPAHCLPACPFRLLARTAIGVTCRQMRAATVHLRRMVSISISWCLARQCSAKAVPPQCPFSFNTGTTTDSSSVLCPHMCMHAVHQCNAVQDHELAMFSVPEHSCSLRPDHGTVVIALVKVVLEVYVPNEPTTSGISGGQNVSLLSCHLASEGPSG